MAICPINRNVKIEGECGNLLCFNNIGTLEYRCLALHCSVFNVRPNYVMTNLFGKKYKMQLSLALKATRIAWSAKELTKREKEPKGFEKYWYDRIISAKPIMPNLSWVDMINDNGNYLISDRMAQVLYTMDIQEYPLSDICREYKSLFGPVDPIALSIPSDKVEEFQDFLEEVL